MNKEMGNWNYVSLGLVAKYERAKKDKIYIQGSTLIPLSACIVTPIEFLREDTIVEERYLVVTPNVGVNPLYLNIAIQMEWKRFKHKYVNNINLQIESFKFYTIKMVDKSEQDKIAETVLILDTAIENIEKTIEHEKNIKKYMMKYMFVR